MIGKTLAHYEIVESIGAGGMGEVYRARDTKLDRDVALKVLPPEASRDPERRRRFETEAKAVAALRHPNIVTIYSVDRADGVHFLTMELVEGRTLRELLSPSGLPVDRFFEIAVSLTDAVSCAHESGVTHRDLKPTNIMVDRDGRLKVLDFGLAKLRPQQPPDLTKTMTAEEQATVEGRILGTVAYMSPEQAEGKTTGPQSDVFALGTILYELLTGAAPFRGSSAMKTLAAVMTHDPLPVTELRPDLPADLVEVVAKCLEKNPEKRYANATELRDALKQLRAPEGSDGGPMTTGAGAPTASPPTVRSIAVLPFTNLSADADNEYFSDGMTEEIINALAHLGGIRVAARTSSFSFKGKNPAIQEIGDALHVETVLEGSVRRAGNRVRITAQLINVSDGYPLWSERFDRTLDDIFALQDEIAQAIAHKLEVSLGAARAQDRRTRNLDAYDLYLRGRFYWEQRGKSLLRAQECFEAAVELDPDFALAHAGVAAVGTTLVQYDFVDSVETFPRAKEAAQRAIDLDPDSAEGHSALAHALLLWDHDWPAAEEEFRRAIELDSRYPIARYGYALNYLFFVRGRVEEAIEEARCALAVDPRGMATFWNLCLILYGAGRGGEIALEPARLVAREPNAFLPFQWEGFARAGLGQYEAAIEMYLRAAELSGRYAYTIISLAEAYVATNRTAEAEALQAELLARTDPKPTCFVYRAAIPAMLGEIDTALGFLREAVARRECWVIQLARSPWFDNLRDDPRLDEILRRIGLTREPTARL